MTNERKRKVCGNKVMHNFMKSIFQVDLFLFYINKKYFCGRFKFLRELKTVEMVALNQPEPDAYVNGRKTLRNLQVSQAHLEHIKEHFLCSANKVSQESFNGHLMLAHQI